MLKYSARTGATIRGNFGTSQTRSRRARKGQAVVEMALVAPVLLLLSLLLVQFAIVMNAASTLTNLSREGARFAATQPQDDDVILARMQAVCPPNIKWSDISSNIVITPTNESSRIAGSLVKVQITYSMRKKAFLPTSFFGVPIFNTNFVTYTTMMVE